MEEVKQVIVVRKDLNMRKGKIAAQVAHASMKVILDKMFKFNVSLMRRHEWVLYLPYDSPSEKWLGGLFTKVVVYVESEDELLKLRDEAKEAGIIHALITDAGKTEFHGEPTLTCMAIGPDYSEKIDGITGDLSLL